ncbi:MAG: YifB family Mg chelatase-like AAA ATPase [Candidatus Gracilibacteria bacterium]|jgi:magnesium chelatase family protein
MAIKIFSCINQGLEGKLVEVEADILQGLSAFSIVGLGDMAVQEAKERIRSAIKNSGFNYPQTKKVINLAPAHVRKHGPQFDLPMAIGLLAASKQIPENILQEMHGLLIVGELALDGAVRPINGILTMAIFAKKNGWSKIIIPKENVAEASLVSGLEIIPLSHLNQIRDLDSAKNIFNSATVFNISEQEFSQEQSGGNGNGSHEPFLGQESVRAHRLNPDTFTDFSDIVGQEIAKRALTISAAGKHHCLLIGPPGVGKTLLAKAFPGILPPLSEGEMLEVMQIYSSAGLLQHAQNSQKSVLMTQRPFRQIHSSSSLLALTGGGIQLKPGEISLAHHGVLFLDEIAEFPRSHLESLRQPLEEKEIYVSRSSGTVKYPANFTLIAGMNPCPCGYYGDPEKSCICPANQVIRYQKKLSGPLRDRIDLVIEVPRQSISKFQEADNVETKNAQSLSQNSAAIKEKIINARLIQAKRFSADPNELFDPRQQSTSTSSPNPHFNSNGEVPSSSRTNSEMTPPEIKKYCPINKECQDLLKLANEKFNFSGRNYHQILKTARTIADLENHENIQLEDLSEALQLRHRNR